MSDERCPGCGGGLADGKCTIGCEARKEFIPSVPICEYCGKHIGGYGGCSQQEACAAQRTNALIAKELSAIRAMLERNFPQRSGKIRNV